MGRRNSGASGLAAVTGGGAAGPGGRLVDTLSGVRVLVVGDVMLDRYMRGSVDRVSPEAPVPVVRLERTEEAPGGAGNVAAGVAALEGRCRLVAPIGDDRAGRTVERLLDDAGVQASHLVVAGDRPTTVKTRVIGRDRQMLRVDRESRAPLEGGAGERILSAARAATADADAVVLADYGKGALGETLIREVIEAASERDVPVVADPSPGRLDRFRGAHVLTPNRTEARGTLGGDGGALAADEDLRGLRRRLGVRHLLVTLGGEGMCLAGPAGDVRRIAAEKVEVYDVTGAGDTVAAVVAAALSAGAPSVAAAARLANQAAALTVQKLGARPVSLEELRAAADRGARPSTIVDSTRNETEPDETEESMSRRVISTDDAPEAIGPYSQAILADGWLYTAGQIGLDPDTGEFVGEGVEEQARRALANLEAVLAEAGLDFGDVVKTTVFLADMDDYGAVNEIYGEHFEDPYPARSAVEAATLPRSARVEIELVARAAG